MLPRPTPTTPTSRRQDQAEIEIDQGLFEVHTFTDPRHGFRYATAMSRAEGTEVTIGKHFIDEGKAAEERWRTAASDEAAAQLALDAIEGDYDCDADDAPQSCEDLADAQAEKRAAELSEREAKLVQCEAALAKDGGATPH